MENVHYVNDSVDERSVRREGDKNGLLAGSKIFMLVGVSFGLLCIIQAALNISFWLHAAGLSDCLNNVSTSNLTMSANDVRNLIIERDRLIQENDQLNQKINQLNQKLDQLNQENNQLKQKNDQLKLKNHQLNLKNHQLNQKNHQLNQNNNHLKQENNRLNQTNHQLNQKNNQLNHENSQLNKIKDKLNQEKENLVREKKQLHEQNDQLEKDKKELQVINANQQLQIQKPRTQTNMGCPQRWVRFQSSCYQVSSIENTWDFAKQDCESKGAHLVIINDQLEERVIKAIGGTMWFGLSGLYDSNICSWTWTWVDGSRCNSGLQLPYGFACFTSCVYGDPNKNHLIPADCRELRHWMCEMEL